MKSYCDWTGARLKRLRELAPSGIGTKAITDLINKEFGTNHTPAAVQQCAWRYGSPIARTAPKMRKRGKSRRMWTDQEDQIARTMLSRGASLVMVSLEIFEVTEKYRSDDSVRDRAYLKGWPRKKKYRHWTPQEDDEMRRLLAAGLDQQGVADAMGIKKKRVKHRMGTLGLAAEPAPAWPKDRRQALKTLVDQGLSASEIGLAMGVSKSTVIGQCKRHGFKLALLPGHGTTRRVSMGSAHGVSP